MTPAPAGGAEADACAAGGAQADGGARAGGGVQADASVAAGLVYHPGGGVRAQVHVTVPIHTLMGVSDAPGELLSGEPVPASVARRIGADPTCTWYRLLTDEAGNLLDLSTRSYRPSAPLIRALVARDRTCIAPGCGASAQTGQTDHTVEAARWRGHQLCQHRTRLRRA